MLMLVALFACSDPAPPAAPVEPEPVAEKVEAPPAAPKHAALFGTLPDHMHQGAAPAKELVDLGRQLYYDARLSKNQDVSCNSCHMLDKYGVDNEPTSPGHKGQRGGRNSPSSYNAAMHLAQFWDGRAADVEAQAKGPVLNPIEMAMPDEASVEKVLASIPGYVDGFKAAFPGDEKSVSYDNMAKAIGAFERGLVTKNSRFDKYLAGDAAALTAEEVEGLDLYVATGCTTCHMGPAMGGMMYQKLGVVHPYETADTGRKQVTNQDADEKMFKVPSLRNVDQTGPYFHDGSVATLEDAVRLMAHHQLGKDLDAAQIGKIVAFLKTATGEIPSDYIAKPELPASGPETPKADPS
jgi:cytochrome c peroxidase